MTPPDCICGCFEAEHTLDGFGPCLTCDCPAYTPSEEEDMSIEDLKTEPGFISPWPPVEWPTLGRQLFERFASRKLLLAACSIIALVHAGAYTEAAAVALGYLGVQGLKDAKK